VPLDLSGPVAEWPDYGGDKSGTRFSPLTQVTPANVGWLERVWVYHSGDVFDGSTTLGKSSFQNTPLVVDGGLYFCTPRNRVIALDPETGAERWSFDPGVDVSNIYTMNCRGVSTWVDPAAPEDAACRRRIITGTLDGRLIALDARTGQPCAGFGKGGTVDLREGIGDTQPGEYGVTSAPLVVGDAIVTGTMVLDNRRVDAPGGVVRAYDARSGALRWGWDPVLPDVKPQGEGVRWVRGTTNAWTTLVADPALGLVYVPTGNTSPDYWGGHRNALDYYSSSVVALSVTSGEVVWHFQAVHHDVWDYDLASPATLVDWPGPQGPVPALVQPSKMGYLFVLDRRTGRPLLEVIERPAPQAGGLPDDPLAPTQPAPAQASLRLHPETLAPDDAFGFTFWDRRRCRELIASLRSDGIYTPPGLTASVQYPGMVGGMNWGGAAVDAQRGLVVVNVQRIATLIRLVPRADFEREFGDSPPRYGFEPQGGSPYALERRPLLSPFGAPCNPPPWGELVGIDLASGETRWRSVLGTTRDLAPWPLWFEYGTPNLGGPLLTASGLVFIGATTDHFLRAFDSASGSELWRARLPTSAHATPMTYRLRPDGRQYVVVAAGGHGLLGSPPGDALVAFALPR
jgi:quinoprotein glucose dehydrogenase